MNVTQKSPIGHFASIQQKQSAFDEVDVPQSSSSGGNGKRLVVPNGSSARVSLTLPKVFPDHISGVPQTRERLNRMPVHLRQYDPGEYKDVRMNNDTPPSPTTARSIASDSYYAQTDDDFKNRLAFAKNEFSEFGDVLFKVEFHRPGSPSNPFNESN